MRVLFRTLRRALQSVSSALQIGEDEPLGGNKLSPRYLAPLCFLLQPLLSSGVSCQTGGNDHGQQRDGRAQHRAKQLRHAARVTTPPLAYSYAGHGDARATSALVLAPVSRS